ncbi:hypothetical protein [Phnomibacter ginsenosidimutans]|uniref:Uncharacterized protein n=1 Tax=Phnomibacter ginsenosidimutans TaxID=2676868 RepID=A0A6I6H235_9BACT|nr:hypothetical protein [Phnomibacter ginsenosidimutans]QGW28681.1 hypothetical protein GLV81_11755 [Phnomibacter ginsenosidimutans]
MRNSICISTFTLLIFACGQTNQKTDKLEKSGQTISTGSKTQTAQSTETITKLDSIEKENNNSIVDSKDSITKAFVFLKDGDSTIYLIANIKKDHRIFGYASPDVKSERLLLLSVFTNDVENNPFGCRLGAYYDTNGMNELTLKYNSTTGNFIKATAIDKANNSTTIFIEKKWIEFE